MKTKALYDAAVIELKNDVQFSPKVKIRENVDMSAFQVLPICLPYQGQEFYNRKVTVAGWGMYGPDSTESRKLRRVDLRVSTDNRRQCKMFRSEIDTNWFGVPKDTCAGDSGTELLLYSYAKSSLS